MAGCCAIFSSFSTVFQSYEDGGRVIMKVVCNGILFTVEKKSTFSKIGMNLDRWLYRTGLNWLLRLLTQIGPYVLLNSFRPGNP